MNCITVSNFKCTYFNDYHEMYSLHHGSQNAYLALFVQSLIWFYKLFLLKKILLFPSEWGVWNQYILPILGLMHLIVPWIVLFLLLGRNGSDDLFPILVWFSNIIVTEANILAIKKKMDTHIFIPTRCDVLT